MTLPEAIGQIEGVNIPNSRAQRNNNPGNLNFAPYQVEKYGAVLETLPAGRSGKPRFAHFPTMEVGWAALHDLLSGPRYYGLTIEEAINKYAPPSENNTTNYVEFVCSKVGCKPTDTVATVLAV